MLVRNLFPSESMGVRKAVLCGAVVRFQQNEVSCGTGGSRYPATRDPLLLSPGGPAKGAGPSSAGSENCLWTLVLLQPKSAPYQIRVTSGGASPVRGRNFFSRLANAFFHDAG